MEASCKAYIIISIHALREEGDPNSCTGYLTLIYFYPRPPRGGRLFTSLRRFMEYEISIHALREEGDVACVYCCVSC